MSSAPGSPAVSTVSGWTFQPLFQGRDAPVEPAPRRWSRALVVAAPRPRPEPAGARGPPRRAPRDRRRAAGTDDRGRAFDGTLDRRGAAGRARPPGVRLVRDRCPGARAAFAAAIADRDAAFGPDRWPANVLSNHDQPRHASRFDVGERARDAPARATPGPRSPRDAADAARDAVPVLRRGDRRCGTSRSRTPRRSTRRPGAPASSPRGGTGTRLAGRCPGTGTPEAASRRGGRGLPLPPDFASRNVEAQAADPDFVLRPTRSCSGCGGRHRHSSGAPGARRDRRRRRLSYVRRERRRVGIGRAELLVSRSGSSTPRPAGGRSWRVAL